MDLFLILGGEEPLSNSKREKKKKKKAENIIGVPAKQNGYTKQNNGKKGRIFSDLKTIALLFFGWTMKHPSWLLCHRPYPI